MLPLFLSACFIALTFGADIKDENGVLVLTTANIEDALKENPNILIEFCKYTSVNTHVHKLIR